MAYDDYTYQRHLTPRGWIEGPRPDDAVETVETNIFQASGWSKEQRSHRSIWRSPKISDEQLANLHSRFGGVPRDTVR